MFRYLMVIYTFGIFLFASETLTFDPKKIYVVDFFASWCSSCEKEIPIFSKVSVQMKNSNIVFIGVDVDKDKAEGLKFQGKMAKYLSFKVINDDSNAIINEFKPLGMPAVYVIKNQKVCNKIFGASADFEKKLLQKIEECL